MNSPSFCIMEYWKQYRVSLVVPCVPDENISNYHDFFQARIPHSLFSLCLRWILFYFFFIFVRNILIYIFLKVWICTFVWIISNFKLKLHENILHFQFPNWNCMKTFYDILETIFPWSIWLAILKNYWSSNFWVLIVFLMKWILKILWTQ